MGRWAGSLGWVAGLGHWARVQGIGFRHFSSSSSSPLHQNKSSKTRTPEPQHSKARITPQKSSSRTRATPTKKTTPSAKGRKATPPRRPSPRGSRGEVGEVRKGLSFGQRASSSSSAASDGEAASLLWVDKYKPRALKGLIGQQGEQSCANKLLRWLQSWYRQHTGDKKPAGV